MSTTTIPEATPRLAPADRDDAAAARRASPAAAGDRRADADTTAMAAAEADLQRSADAAVLRRVCGVGAAACLLMAVLLRWPAAAQSLLHDGRAAGNALAGACLLAALAFGAAVWRVGALSPSRQRALLRVLAGVCVVLVGGLSLGSGAGVHAIQLSFFGLLVCLGGLLLGRRDAIAIALACAAIVAALAAATAAGGLPTTAFAAADGTWSTARAAATQLLLIGCGLGVGLTMADAAAGAARRVAEREQRFGTLLDIAADVYWELDAGLRLTRFGRIEPGRPGVWQQPASAGGPIGELPFDTMDEPARSAHVADLQARRPFTDLRMVRHGPNGGAVHLAVSGRPRFAADGRFIGYWGVSRDVTNETRTQRAVASSEARYRDLFERAPSPLVLHRQLRVLAANPAGAALFGFTATGETADGYALDGLLDDDAMGRQLAQRVALLATLPVGSSLPVCDYAVRTVDGRHLTVQVSSVQVDTADGPAALSIFVDITERVAAELALRESRNTLAALFTNSPDGMALTLVETGRYVMANETCARMIGYRPDELIGRSAVELNIWHDASERARLLATLAVDGRVQEMPAVFNTRSGGTIALTVSAARIEVDGQAHLLSTLRDVSQTEQLRLEHAAVFRGALVGIALLRDQCFQLANPRFEDIFGWPRGTLKGQPSAAVWPDAEQYAADRRNFRPLLSEGRPITLERPMRRADGSTFWCRLQAQAIDPGNPLDNGTVWIGEDITERRQLDAQLAAARDEALESSRAKSAFLANTSHEIRTPLNGLIGLAKLAAHDDLAPALRQQYLGHIVDSAQGLAAIISDILDLSKIEAGRLGIDREPLALRDLLQVLHGTYRPLAEARGLKLRLDVDDAVPVVVLGDAMRLRQVLDNYLTNALKFTTRGEVRIGARRVDGDAERLRLSVADSGPGIGVDVRQRLFAPFTQADQSTTRRYGGTGLGLSICRELAALMGGTVGVESVAGHGSNFWVELPLPADHPAPAAAALPAVANANADDVADDLAGMQVLVVEDNPVNMLIAQAMLTRWGADVTEAADGAQAIDAVAAAVHADQPFHAVLMDVQMPEMSGHEATRRLRRDFDAQALPIIALTAAALVEERDKARAAGMNDFLTKPIDADRLFDTLRRYRQRSAQPA